MSKLSKEDYWIRVGMVNDVTLEYKYIKRSQMDGWRENLISPTDFCIEWCVKQNTPLALKLSTEKDSDYQFTGQCTNTFEIMFSGTFFIAEQILQRVFPDAILFECCQFLIG